MYVSRKVGRTYKLVKKLTVIFVHFLFVCLWEYRDSANLMKFVFNEEIKITNLKRALASTKIKFQQRNFCCINIALFEQENVKTQIQPYKQLASLPYRWRNQAQKRIAKGLCFSLCFHHAYFAVALREKRARKEKWLKRVRSVALRLELMIFVRSI